MREVEIQNAKIISTMLGREDHGILTAYITVEGDGWGCGFGGFAFDQWKEAEKRRIGHSYGMEFLARVLDVVGVDSWEKLIGQHVRVETEGWGGRIRRLGHITKDKWFDPQALSDTMRERVSV